MQVRNYASMQVCKYASMQVCKYAGMKLWSLLSNTCFQTLVLYAIWYSLKMILAISPKIPNIFKYCHVLLLFKWLFQVNFVWFVILKEHSDIVKCRKKLPNIVKHWLVFSSIEFDVELEFRIKKYRIQDNLFWII